MTAAIYREFLKLLPRRTLLWAAGLWVALLVLSLVFLIGNHYLVVAEQVRYTGPDSGAPADVHQQWVDLAAGFVTLLSPRFAPSHGLALYSVLGTLIVTVMASKLFGDEYTLGTIRRLWTKGPPRTLPLAGKLGAVGLAIVGGMVLSIVVAVSLTPVVRWFYPIPWPAETPSAPPGQLAGQLALQLLAVLLVASFLAILAGLIASATRSALAGSLIALVLLYLDPLLPAPLQRISPFWHQRTLLRHAFPEFATQPGAAGPALPGMMRFDLPPGVGPEASPAVALAVLAAYVLLLVGLLHVVWKRQEVQ